MVLLENIFVNLGGDEAHETMQFSHFSIGFYDSVCMKPAGKLENKNPFSISKEKPKRISSSDLINPSIAGNEPY